MDRSGPSAPAFVLAPWALWTTVNRAWMAIMYDCVWGQVDQGWGLVWQQPACVLEGILMNTPSGGVQIMKKKKEKDHILNCI